MTRAHCFWCGKPLKKDVAEPVYCSEPCGLAAAIWAADHGVREHVDYWPEPA